MSASYTRVNWANYPATTTPVNAENLNKMDAGIAGLTSEINSVESDVSALNSSLTASDNLKFRFATDGEGNYGYLDGDDTFVPFSNSAVKSMYCVLERTDGLGTLFAINEDGTFGILELTTGNTYPFWDYINEHCNGRFTVNRGGGGMPITIMSAGYYAFCGFYSMYNSPDLIGPSYYNVGDTINTSYHGQFHLFYFGNTDPTQ